MIMKLKYLYLLLLATMVVACKDEFTLDTPDFQVDVPKQTFAVGEEVTFNFTGTADLLSFYSGERFHNFDYTGGRVVETISSLLSFNTFVTNGTQADHMSVLITTDFDGDYSYESVEQANWIDITEEFNLAPDGTSLPSGEFDISPYYEEGKQLYVAFRYNVRNQSVHGSGRIWRMENFRLTANNELGTSVLANNILTAQFQFVEEENKPEILPKRSTMTSNRIQMVGHRVDPNVSGSATAETRLWAVSKGFEFGDIDFGPDRSIPIKGVADNKLEQYTHVYHEPGVYKVVFLAKNANGKNENEIIKEIEITVL